LRQTDEHLGDEQMKQHYVVRDGKVTRTNPFCPRCGVGVFMADKGEWWSCGKCGDRYNKKIFDSKSK
jgi:small subunit ribosomal protein S27Ae